MSTYEPGTVAIATVNGIENVRAFRTNGKFYPWTTADDENQADDWVTDVRPLVVLDLDDPDAYGCSAVVHDPAKIVKALRDTNSVAAHAIAAQIEAQTKPPRIPEPGLWGVVEASSEEPKGGRRTFVRASAVGTLRWIDVQDDGVGFNWSELVDPVLIRDGIEDAS